jgi:hypothetical protein
MVEQTQTVTDNAVEHNSLALAFLEAVLMKDAKALRAYGLDDKMTATIDLETQITVATKLLQSENTKARSTSKRVQAAQVLGTQTRTVISKTPAPCVTGTTARFFPNPSRMSLADFKNELSH